MSLYDPHSESCVAKVEWWATIKSEILVVGENGAARPFINEYSGEFGIPKGVREDQWNDWALRFVQFMFKREPNSMKLRVSKYCEL